ncbi:MAG: hypothetical protein ACK559_22875 [bacterium]
MVLCEIRFASSFGAARLRRPEQLAAEGDRGFLDTLQAAAVEGRLPGRVDVEIVERLGRQVARGAVDEVEPHDRSISERRPHPLLDP